MEWDRLADLGNVVALGSAVVATLISAIGAVATQGLFRRFSSRGAAERTIDSRALEHIRQEIAQSRAGTPIPFEVEQLSGYYALTLGQARVSFWFSLIFASVGFIVIISAGLLYSGGDYVSASIKVVSGLVIDAVSALFFVQSRRAQESMSAFFEKLRSDRQFVEARRICDEIKNEDTKDKIKTMLVLHYSGIDASSLTSSLKREQDLLHKS